MTDQGTDAAIASQQNSEQNLNDDSKQIKSGICKLACWKSFSGLIIVVLMVVSWILQAQFSNNIATRNFTSFAFLSWYARSWTVICYPIYCIYGLLVGKSIGDMWNECSVAIKYKGTYYKGIIIKVLPVSLLFSLGSYCYYFALTRISAGDFTAIVSSNIALIYILSIFLLKEQVVLIRVFAVLISIAGVVLFAYSNGFLGGSALGVIFSLSLALISSVYRVSLKVVLVDPAIGKAAFYVSTMSLCIAFTIWPIVLLFHLIGFEVLDWETLPWDNLNSIAGLGVLFNTLMIFGIAITYPIFVSLGVLLGIPGNAIVDAAFRQVYFDYIKIIGALCICTGFLLLLIPIDKAKKISNFIIYPCKKQPVKEDIQTNCEKKKTFITITETRV